MRARIISRLQRAIVLCRSTKGRPLNEGQDYIPATTALATTGLPRPLGRSMRARIISRLQLSSNYLKVHRLLRSMRARIISRLQRVYAHVPGGFPFPLNEGQDYIPATTFGGAGGFGLRRGTLNEGQDYIPATTRPCVAVHRQRRPRSMRARIISRLQLDRQRVRVGRINPLNEGQDYIPATTVGRRGFVRPGGGALNEGQDYIPATTRLRTRARRLSVSAQ